ncbi:uracil-DNA glycosylase family protein [Reyranella sp.]|uniref:uracil-DNA glycosylase family protein n=1 Tax=Reyranella sp. TaxID=1929291 RepID=UPI0037847922
MSLKRLLRRVRACAICETALPLGARPILQLAGAARLLIIGQAPGRKAHATGLPWNDASGDRLRDWMGLDRAAFHDEGRVAILPIGLCYPGSEPGGGDKPPRRECAPLWHARLLKHLPAIEATLLVGHHAQRFYLGSTGQATMTDTVKAFRQYGPRFVPLPHPSWRSTLWMREHPWFEAEVVPELRRIVRRAARP